MKDKRHCIKCSLCEKVYKTVGYSFDRDLADKEALRLRESGVDSIVIETDNKFLVCVCNGFKCSANNTYMTLEDVENGWCHKYNEVSIIKGD